jgi:Mg-chelatase subunit ChlD
MTSADIREKMRVQPTAAAILFLLDACSFGYGRQIARAMGAHYLLAEEIVERGVIELPL